MAESRPLAPRLMAAMAQQDCGQCGYNCADYANALFLKKEERLNLCAPGGKETLRALKKLAEEFDAALPEAKPAAPAVVSDAPAVAGATAAGHSREEPAEGIFLSRRRLNAPHSEKETWHVEIDLAASGLGYEVGDSLGVFAANRSGPRRFGDRPARRAAGADDRGADAARASLAQGRSRTGARRAVPAPLLRDRRRAAPEMPGACGGRRSRRRRGNARRAWGAAEIRAGPARRGSVRRGVGRASAAALLDRLLAQGRRRPGGAHGRCRSLRDQQAAPPRRRLDLLRRAHRARRPAQALCPDGARLRAAAGPGDRDHHGRAGNRRRPVPRLPARAARPSGRREGTGSSSATSARTPTSSTRTSSPP